MSTTTTNFDLFKYDTTADAQTAFSITNALNNNWDKLDANCVKRGSTTAATGSTTRPVYVDASGQIQPCANDIPTGDFLTATTSLAENGYIKFSNVFNIQWGHTGNIPGSGGLIVTLPTSCEEALFSVVATMFNIVTGAHHSRLMVSEFQKTLFVVDWSDGTYVDPVVWISVGT